MRATSSRGRDAGETSRARSSVVNGTLRGPKEQRSFKPQAAGSIPAGRTLSSPPRASRPVPRRLRSGPVAPGTRAAELETLCVAKSTDRFKLTFCVIPDLYVRRTEPRQRRGGAGDGVVLRPAAPEGGARQMEVRLTGCHERRMSRSLHGRWPYRRSHCRHDHHWFAHLKSQGTWCPGDRAHSLAALRSCTRRP